MPRSRLAPVREFRLPATQSPAAEAIPSEREKPARKGAFGPQSSPRASETIGLRRQVVAYAFKHLDRFASLEAKVFVGEDTKAIHDIRVATRRLQTALDLLFPKPRPAEFRKLRRRLKKCRRILSEVRNCDVIAARAETALGRKRTGHREAWTAFKQYLDERRPKSFSKAVRRLGKANLAASYPQLKRLLGQAARVEPPDAQEAKDREGKEASRNGFETRVISRLEVARKAFEKRLEACLARPDAQASHQVRIAAKRLRYVIEILHECGIPSSSDALVWFRSIQTHLGHLHDTDILDQMLIDMIARPPYLREHLELSIEAARLIIKMRRRKQIMVDRFLHTMTAPGQYERIRNWLTGLPQSLLEANRRQEPIES